MKIIKFPGLRFGHTVYFYSQLNSTQEKAKELSKNNAQNGTIIACQTQTQGRGRGYKIWVSEKGGLYLSIIYYPLSHVIEVEKLTKSLAIVTKRAIEKIVSPLCLIDLEIKHINDLLLNKKKLAGILVETDFFAGLNQETNNWPNIYILGIGVNVNQTDFPIALKDIATSLLLETRHRFSRYQIMKAICDELSFLLP